MAKKNEYGKYILSAGEIATYTICPESWRLTQEDSVVETVDIDNIKVGHKLHKEWSEALGDAVYFTHSITLFTILIALTLLFLLLRFFFGT